jgi:hypothetical protein
MAFSFFWVFCTSLPFRVEHTWLKLQLHIYKYEWARIIFVARSLDSKLQHHRPCKNSWKKLKNSHSDRSGHIERDTTSKKKVKKSEKPRFYEQNKLWFENHDLEALGSFSHMAAYRSSLDLGILFFSWISI